MDGNQQIFISIASYRDRQLVPTVMDLVHKADEPSLLRFGICWQHGPDEEAPPFADDPLVRILDVPWQQSGGACWARAEAMKLWQGEQWFLQVDSHCRFARGWDTKLIRMAAQTGSPKPILSTYGNAFSPAEPGHEALEVLNGDPHLIAIEKFTDDGIPNLKPVAILDARKRSKPLAARFLAAGFLFAPGSLVQDVPYDPELYFFGEEISMTVRAFTAGYDLFHPIETLVWHDYIRSYAKRHWNDHEGPGHDVPGNEEPASQTAWTGLDTRSRNKVTALLAGDSSEVGGFGLGAARTLVEYEAFAGVSFRLRKMQNATRAACEPPNPPEPEDWPDRIYNWLVRTAVDPASLSPCAFDPSGFWMFTVLDESRREIRRHDFSKQELGDFTGKEAEIVLVCELQSGIIPVFWVLRPFSNERGWGIPIDGQFGEADYAIIREEDDPELTTRAI